MFLGEDETIPVGSVSRRLNLLKAMDDNSPRTRETAKRTNVLSLLRRNIPSARLKNRRNAFRWTSNGWWNVWRVA
ncbi:MAG: hypothetical protein ACTS4V_00525 [Candidatus Hodgkinia cicadicola]